MGSISNFKELKVWQLANEICNTIYHVMQNTGLKTDYDLKSQIDKSSGSVSDNIAEGFDRDGNKEFIHFLTIAKGSNSEVRSQLERVKLRGYISASEYEEIEQKCISLSKQLTSFINYLKSSNLSATKFKDPKEEYTSPSNKEQIIKNQKPTFFKHDTAIIDEGCSIGKGTKVWHFSHIMPNCVIGENCNIGQNCVISPEVVLGKNVKIQNNVSIYTGVICEDDVFLGPSMVFTNVINPRSGVNRRGQYTKTLVKKGASIGANATIVCGHDIGQYAFIGAGAVVTKEIPDYALVIGNPAKQVGWMSEYGHKLIFNDQNEATCPESNEKYKIDNNIVFKIK